MRELDKLNFGRLAWAIFLQLPQLRQKGKTYIKNDTKLHFRQGYMSKSLINKSKLKKLLTEST